MLASFAATSLNMMLNWLLISVLLLTFLPSNSMLSATSLLFFPLLSTSFMMLHVFLESFLASDNFAW